MVRHGWHAGIAVRRADVPDTAWPILGDFPAARYLEIGWGEAGYYTGRSRGVWGTVRAGAWPTRSVLHVVPVPEGVLDLFSAHTVVRVPVGPDHWAAAALEAAGCAVWPRGAFTVGQVIEQAQTCGTLVQHGASD